MIRKIEELSMNAFPSLETVFYDGWVIRMSEGKSKRVNSVYSLYPSTITLEKKVSHCEEIFVKNRLRRVFKLTEQETCAGLDAYLRNRGYVEAGRTFIKTLDLSGYNFESDLKFEYFSNFSGEWYRELCDAESRSAIDRKVVAEAWKMVIPDQCFIALKKDGKRVAFGRGVMDSGYMGIYGIYVAEKYRRRGYGEIITKQLLSYGKKSGCHNAYLQVEAGNPNGINLYNKIGFEQQYQYWYLLKDVGDK